MKKTKTGKLDKRTKFYERLSFWVNRRTLAAAMWGLIIGSLFGCYLADRPNGSLKPTGQSLPVKVEEVKAIEIPCDYDPITYVRCRGQQLGYDDFTISKFIRIARAESNFNPMAKNRNSTATGIYQFINGTWHAYCKGKNVYDFKDNIDCFYKVLETDGYPKALNHWNASRSKWEK